LGTAPVNLLPLAGGGLTVALGALGPFRPDAASDLVGIAPESERGCSEVRATYGGIFLGLGGACLLVQAPDAYLVAASAWTSAGLARTASVLYGRSIFRENLAGILAETGIGLLFAAGVA